MSNYGNAEKHANKLEQDTSEYFDRLSDDALREEDELGRELSRAGRKIRFNGEA